MIRCFVRIVTPLLVGKTLEIEKGIIHNPHYFEYMRNHADGGAIPRQHGDEMCGGLPQFYFSENKSERDTMNNVLQIIHHIRNTSRRPVPTDTSGLRVRFLLNEIDEDKFGTLLTSREVTYERERAYFELREMLVNVATDIIQRLQSHVISYKDARKELDSIRDYFNEKYFSLAKKFKHKYYTSITKSRYDFFDMNERNLTLGEK